MIRQLFTVGIFVGLTGNVFAGDSVAPPIFKQALNDSKGTPQAVIVQGYPLVHTRQILPFDHDGKIVGVGSADRQIEQVLDNLDAALKDSTSGMKDLVRVNVYAMSAAIVSDFREHLNKRLDLLDRPVMTAVLTPLPDRKALVAVDAVAASDEQVKSVKLVRCSAITGNDSFAEAAILPRGGVVYLSGQPDEGGLDASAVARSLSGLTKTMGHLKLLPKDIVQVKVFLRPMTSAEEVRHELRKFFPNQPMPPVVFVEWLAAVPVEIEMIAALPPSNKSSEEVVYFTPPEVRPSNTFSKATLVHGERQIYISGLYARVPSRGEPQAVYLFDQLQEVLKASGSDMRHLVKASYYVSDDDAARWIDRLRPRVFDPSRPPAASKVMVHGVGMSQRTMTVDMIAVPAKPQ